MTRDEFIKSHSSGGFSIVPNALFRLPISGNDFKLLAHISAWDNPSGKDWPRMMSNTYIATLLTATINTAKSSRDKLIEAGYISQHNYKNSYHYSVNWAKIKRLT